MRLRRHPLAFWAVATALAVLTGFTVARLVGTAADRAARLGGLRSVPVAARPLDAGQRVTGGDVEVREVPRAALPDGVVARSPVGHATVVPVARGEVLMEAKLAPWGRKGVAGLVPRGRRALAIPVERGGVPVRRGDRVDVLATFETAEAGTEPTFPVASGALVLDAADEVVTVAVTAHEAPRVAFAVARGAVALALAPD